jgi:hypothetical protein
MQPSEIGDVPLNGWTMTRRGLVAASAGVVVSASLATAGSANAPVGAGGGAPFVDAVLAAGGRHRLVALGEGGEHGLQEHHDALAVLLTDPRLPTVFDDIVVEFGNARFQSTVDRFVAGGLVEDRDLRSVWRDTTQSPLETWDAPVFECFYRTVRAVNATQRAERRLRVLLGDPPIDWSGVTGPDQLMGYQTQRDSHAASVIQRKVLSRGRRALVLYGVTHLFHATAQAPGGPLGLVALLEQQTRERVYVIASLAALAGDPAGLDAKLSGRARRTVVPATGPSLGSLNAGQVFPTAIRGAGGDPTNLTCGVPVGSLIDAGLYLAPTADLTVSRPDPAIYLDPAYWAELQRRNALFGGVVDLNGRRQPQSVRFTPQVLPPVLACR